MFYFFAKVVVLFFFFSEEKHAGICVGTKSRPESLCIPDAVSHRRWCHHGEMIPGTLPRRRANISLWTVRSLLVYEQRSVDPELFAAAEIICLVFFFCSGPLLFWWRVCVYTDIWVMLHNYPGWRFSSRTGSGSAAKGFRMPFCCAILCPIFTAD